jgi:hypothetical protein
MAPIWTYIDERSPQSDLLPPDQKPLAEPYGTQAEARQARVVEPDCILTAQELPDRICDAFDYVHEEHLLVPVPEKVS